MSNTRLLLMKMEQTMTKNTVALDHLNFTVQNFEDTICWYREVFGFEIVEAGTTEDLRPWGVLKCGHSMLCISEDQTRIFPSDKTNAHETLHRIYHFGLRIINRAAWEETLMKRQLPTYYGTSTRYPHSTSWYVKDPTGYMIEVVHWDNEEVCPAAN